MNKLLKKLPLLLLGNLLLAVGVSSFVVPAGLISGGATGLALAFSHLLPALPLDFFIWGSSLLFLLLGWFFLGREFALSTLISSVAYPLFFSLVSALTRGNGPMTEDIVLNTAYAGLSFGVGVGIIMRTGASTGGSDAIAMILNKRLGLPLSPMLYGTEALILCLQIPFSSSERILYGLIFVLIYSVTLEKVMLFGTGKVQISIYSRAYEEINRMIVTNMDRGSTLYKVRGGYSGEDSWVVETVVPKRSLFPLREKILAIDPKAFVVVNPISEVNGRGFTLNKNA